MDTQKQEQEEFTFPTPTTTPPRFISSPPLWHRTNSLHNQIKKKRPTNQEDGEGYNFAKSSPPITIFNNDINQRKSFSYVEDYRREDEQMDMLWEDLNEEYSKNRGLLPGPNSGESPARMVSFGCVKAGGKRPKLVVFVKVVKKLFLLHDSHRSLSRRDRGKIN